MKLIRIYHTIDLGHQQKWIYKFKQSNQPVQRIPVWQSFRINETFSEA